VGEVKLLGTFQRKNHQFALLYEIDLEILDNKKPVVEKNKNCNHRNDSL
jgi:hypothetical protein